MNDLYRTGVHALAAVFAFIIVDRSVEILDLYGSGRTFLLAHLAADTAVLASELGRFAVISGRAENVDVLALGLDADELIGTGCCTLSARSAESGIYFGNAVFNFDSVVLADSRTVAETDTAELTRAVSAVEALHSLAGLNSVEIKLRLSGIAVARAVNYRSHRNDLSSGSSEDSGNFAGSVSSSGTAEVCSCTFVYDSVSIVGTACESAGAAVCLRKGFAYLCDALIYLDVKDLGSYGQQDSCEYTAAAENKSWNQIIHVRTSLVEQSREAHKAYRDDRRSHKSSRYALEGLGDIRILELSANS